MGTDGAHGTQAASQTHRHTASASFCTQTRTGTRGGGTYFCLSRASRVLLLRFCRLEGGTEWTEELFLLEEWEE